MSRRYGDLSSPAGDIHVDDSAVNRSFATVTSLNSSTHTTASSSKAVLAALRALQDKIRRLEAERSQALDEASDLRNKLKTHEIETEHSRQRDALLAQKQLQEARSAHEKLLDEKIQLEDRIRKMEERNNDADRQLNELTEQISRVGESKLSSDSRIKELSNRLQSLENQLQVSQQREKGSYESNLLFQD